MRRTEKEQSPHEDRMSKRQSEGMEGVDDGLDKKEQEESHE